MKRRYDNDEIKRLARIIDVLARKCWRGLPALMGDAPKPTREQMRDAFFFRPSPSEDLGTKVQGGGSDEGREIAREDAMMDEVDAVLNQFAWSELVNTVKWYKQDCPVKWALYRRYIVGQEQRTSWGQTGTAAQLSEVYGLSEYQLREAARGVPYEIARAVSQGYCHDEALHGHE